MAFTDTDKSNIRMYLGYPDINRYVNPRLEGVLDGALSPEAEAIALALIVKLQAVDEQIDTAGVVNATAGALKKLDEIEWYNTTTQGGAGQTVSQLSALGKQYITRLSTLLGVPVFGNYYGTTGYPGDGSGMFGWPYPGVGTGGLLPLG